jgi:hypothetical protein
MAVLLVQRFNGQSGSVLIFIIESLKITLGLSGSGQPKGFPCEAEFTCFVVSVLSFIQL